MNAPTAKPAQPSRSTPVTLEMMAAASTAAVAMTSLRESTAVAMSVVDEMRLPMRRLKNAIQSFTRMESTSTAATTALNSAGDGARILSMEDRISSMPMTTMSAATAKPERYSNLPCP